MEDREILDVIQGLVAEEHRVRDQQDRGTIDPDVAASRLSEVSTRRDEMWATLRKRRALRAAGMDPDAVDLRGPGTDRQLSPPPALCVRNTLRGYAGWPGHSIRRASMAGYTGGKDDYLKRLRRIEGQVRGVQRMVDEDTYCIDVLTQIAAVTKALQAVSLGLLEDHVGHCVVNAARESDEAAAAKVREAAEAIARLVRS